jgi:hypothetical protein
MNGCASRNIENSQEKNESKFYTLTEITNTKKTTWAGRLSKIHPDVLIDDTSSIPIVSGETVAWQGVGFAGNFTAKMRLIMNSTTSNDALVIFTSLLGSSIVEDRLYGLIGLKLISANSLAAEADELSESCGFLTVHTMFGCIGMDIEVDVLIRQIVFMEP